MSAPITASAEATVATPTTTAFRQGRAPAAGASATAIDDNQKPISALDDAFAPPAAVTARKSDVTAATEITDSHSVRTPSRLTAIAIATRAITIHPKPSVPIETALVDPSAAWYG